MGAVLCLTIRRAGLSGAKLAGMMCLLFVASTITAGQSTPTLRINDITAPELDSGFFQRDFEITLSAATDRTVTVMLSTQSGTATGDVDFVAGTATLTFQPGQTIQTMGILIKGDAVVEGTEEFFLNLSNAVNATITDGQGVGTIVDDDTLVLLSQTSSQRAAALDSVFFTSETFSIANTLNFSSDHRTRVILFAIGLKLSAGETVSAVTATAEDSLGTLRPLAVEFVGGAPNVNWLTQVVLKLNDQPSSGDIKIRISLHGETSNAVPVAVKSQ